MPSGGARARSGPPKDPNAVRRPEGTEFVVLPAGGRVGEPPEWPLTDQTVREGELWDAVWALPQAVMWEAHRLEWSVAFYVRNLAEAELPEAKAATRTLVRQQMDDLGLTEGGLAKNGWTVGEPEARREPRKAAQSSKTRLKVVADESA